MASLAPLFPLEKQFQAKDGRNNTGGWLKVYLAATDDPADTYSDYVGTRNPEKIVLDDNGRATVICDKDRAYRLEVYDLSGALMWTEEPVYCSGTGGGGVPVTRLVSTDGSIAIDQSTVGSVTTYDLSSHPEDSAQSLAWIRCDGATNLSGTDTWKPTYTAGTMSVGTKGIVLAADQYYHATARVRVTKSGVAEYYDDLQLVFKTFDGTTDTQVCRKGIIVDGSLALYQDFEISCDVLAETDCELCLDITGKELANIGIEGLDIEVHRVYSGAPYIPDGVGIEYTGGTGIDVDNVNRTISADTSVLQEKLTAGSNITIQDNVISATAAPQEQADWNQNDSSAVDYIKNKPDLSVYATTQAMDTALAGKQDTLTAGQNITIQNNVISATAAPQEQADWNETDSSAVDYIKNKPTIPVVPPLRELVAGSNISIIEGVDDVTISATDTTYAAGTGITISSGTISVDTSVVATQTDLAGKQDVISDLATIRSGAALGATAVQPGDLATVATTGSYTDLSNTPAIPTATSDLTNDSGYITAADIPAQVQADWNESDSSAVDYIKNKPTIPAAQVNSDWNAVSGVSQILNKPTLATVATTGSYTDLSNTPSIPTATSDLTNDSGFITSAEAPVQDVYVDGASVLDANGIAQITLPVIPTIPVTDVEVNGSSVVNAQGVAEVTVPAQVQSDWDETDTTDPAYIANKPTIPAAQVNSDWNAVSGVAQILNRPTLATVATTGDYGDLQNTPSIPVIGTITV